VRRVVAISLILIVAWFVAYFAMTYRGASHDTIVMEKHRLATLTEFLCVYLHENEGRFPESEAMLMEKDWLRKGPPATGYTEETCYIRMGDDEWWLFTAFNSFRLAYGTDVNDVEPRRDGLFSRRDGSPIKLISGDHSDVTPGIYNSASMEVYKKMLQMRTPGAVSEESRPHATAAMTVRFLVTNTGSAPIRRLTVYHNTKTDYLADLDPARQTALEIRIPEPVMLGFTVEYTDGRVIEHPPREWWGLTDELQIVIEDGGQMFFR